MAYEFKVAVNCASPHVLADWWAETLGSVVEEQDSDFIHKMIAEGHSTDADTSTHNGRLVWLTGAAIRHPDGQEPGQPDASTSDRFPRATRRSQELAGACWPSLTDCSE